MRGGRARHHVVRHGNARVDERERRGVDACGENGAVLREDVQGDVDFGTGVEGREDARCERSL